VLFVPRVVPKRPFCLNICRPAAVGIMHPFTKYPLMARKANRQVRRNQFDPVRHAFLRGTFRCPIHTFMLFTAADLAAALVQDLPPEVRTFVEAHFFDGESIFKIQRRYKLKNAGISKR
jgi:hypothetical protein